MKRLLRDAAVMVVVTAVLALACETAVRVWRRARTGEWPETVATMLHDSHRNATRLYRYHPFLHTAPREDMSAVVLGKTMTFNSLGYRSPERPRAKPAGTRRVLCAGGSTTLDILAPSDALVWTQRLENALRQETRPIEVWNAGFPGWTSLENFISLGLRDVDLAPDVVVLFQGINDLQPAAHVPPDPQYLFHAEMSATVLGLDLPPVPWYQRSVLLESLRALVGLNVIPAAHRPGSTPVEHVTEEGITTFRRNVRSLIAVAREHGARVVLATQPMRVRAAHADGDAAILGWWTPDLVPTSVAGELERLNDVLRTLAPAESVALVDIAHDVDWTDDDFGDPLHYNQAGSAKMSAALAPHVGRALESGVP